MDPITRYRLVALLMLVLHLTGCYAWQPVTVGPRQLIEEEQPGQIRILQTDGMQVLLDGPTIRDDSIVGIPGRLRTATIRIALSDIGSVEVRRISTPKTVGTVVLTAAFVLAIASPKRR